ncbi:MAG TPA: glutamate racemase [Haliangiales bacterium]|nr:glutamate racemase [Haliangiales bacterium]
MTSSSQSLAGGPSSRLPIGIFDSGVGGLTVVRAVRAALPAEDVVYLGDTARVPYGNKSPETVVRYSLACARFLERHEAKILLIACNTASAHAMDALSAAIPVPVVGAVAPGARAAHAASLNGHIGVIGTLGTIRSGAYERALRQLNRGARITGQACPLFVPLAEEGWTRDEDHAVLGAIAERYLAELRAKDPDIDTIVLGCTHYPLLRDGIARAAAEVFGRTVALVDSASAMAQAARATLAAAGGLRPEGDATGTLACHVTDVSRLDELAPRFLGEPLASFSVVDL